MNDDTKYLIRRMDQLEARLMAELKPLQEFKNKLIGMGVLAGGIGSLLIEYIKKHI